MFVFKRWVNFSLVKNIWALNLKLFKPVLDSVRVRTVFKEPPGERKIRASYKHSWTQTVTGIPKWEEEEGPYLYTCCRKLGEASAGRWCWGRISQLGGDSDVWASQVLSTARSEAGWVGSIQGTISNPVGLAHSRASTRELVMLLVQWTPGFRRALQ